MEKIFLKLSGDNIRITGAYIIYNRILTVNLINWKSLLQTRWNDMPKLFHTTNWERISSNQEVRGYIKNRFDDVIRRFEWNEGEMVPIICALHGTDISKAFAIAKTGFVSLSTLDSGYYGKGVYFSTHAPNNLVYVINYENPALLMSLIIPGNVYPVVENPRGTNSIAGGPIKPGYNSHYVITDQEGMVISSPSDDTKFDELVVDQECQVLPVFILILDKENVNEILVNMNQTQTKPSLLRIGDEEDREGGLIEI
jgi:hypothetical protein